ncbi:MAG: nucleoside hydrolase [Clostridia bacterium]|nr:nucleoside hydrolase [Clostridia bacterium]
MNDKPIILFDTDMDTDCDDAGAFAMLLRAHKAGEAHLLGVIADSVSPYAASCCEAIARYYGIDIPVGAVHTADYCSSENAARFAAYLAHSENLKSRRSYNHILAAPLAKTDADYPSAKETYRRLLAEAEDQSVTVLCVGMLTALTELLTSEADGISALSGVELVSRKVSRVIAVGNPEKENDFNWSMDAVAAETFFALCPVPVYISADGSDVITGETLSRLCPTDHPIRRAYERWLGKPDFGRASWDLIAALYAMVPETPLLAVNPCGTCNFDAANKRTVFTAGARQDMRITRTCPADAMAAELNKRMTE